MTVTSSKVISLLEIMNTVNLNEERVCGYLTTMLGNMQGLFLRFVTGASVCIAPKIEIFFNSLSGFGRRPIAHTCDFMLELPTTYMNFQEFCGESKAILSSTEEEFAWRMDSV